MNAGPSDLGPLEPVEAIVVLHPAWADRIDIQTLAIILATWGRWLRAERDSRNRVVFYADPDRAGLNIIPTRSGRA